MFHRFNVYLDIGNISNCYTIFVYLALIRCHPLIFMLIYFRSDVIYNSERRK
jgi:hypothetical protein